MSDELVKKIRHCATDPLHCLSCKEVKDGRCFARLMTQAADAIEELSKPRWVPVTERLPEAGDHVLVYAGFFQPFIEVSYIDAEGKWRFAYDDTEVPIVTHWMPLPSTEGLNET